MIIILFFALFIFSCEEVAAGRIPPPCTNIEQSVQLRSHTIESHKKYKKYKKIIPKLKAHKEVVVPLQPVTNHPPKQ